LTHIGSNGVVDWKALLTKEKADALAEKIAKGLEEEHIMGSNNIIAYAMKEAWIAGFEAGRSDRLSTIEP